MVFCQILYWRVAPPTPPHNLGGSPASPPATSRLYPTSSCMGGATLCRIDSRIGCRPKHHMTMAELCIPCMAMIVWSMTYYPYSRNSRLTNAGDRRIVNIRSIVIVIWSD